MTQRLFISTTWTIQVFLRWLYEPCPSYLHCRVRSLPTKLFSTLSVPRYRNGYQVSKLLSKIKRNVWDRVTPLWALISSRGCSNTFVFGVMETRFSFNFGPTAQDLTSPLKESNKKHVSQNCILTSLPVTDLPFNSFSSGNFQRRIRGQETRVNLEITVTRGELVKYSLVSHCWGF